MSVRWLRWAAIFLLVGSALLWVSSSCGFGCGWGRGTTSLEGISVGYGQLHLLDLGGMSSTAYIIGVDDARLLKEREWHFGWGWGDPRRLSYGPLDTRKYVLAVAGNLVAGVQWQDRGPGLRSVHIPLWIPVVVLAAIVAALEFVARRRERRARAGRCAACGYDLRATPKKCPECGLEARSSEESMDGTV